MPCGSASTIKLSYGAPSQLFVERLQADLMLNSLSIWVIPSHSAHDAVWMFDVELQQGPGLHSKLPSPTAFLNMYATEEACVDKSASMSETNAQFMCRGNEF